eukprot:671428-Prymnesium_polylepis.1
MGRTERVAADHRLRTHCPACQLAVRRPDMLSPLRGLVGGWALPPPHSSNFELHYEGGAHRLS